ncbi:hypothetical protein CEXT_781881 [Caerostris extrusa]|uniref:Uncharacterized protein n=1 Tax=Caerostris extrusa TaxID=172846 RepID=A0AAV4VDF6_CAEEX|nr:hypothetical protein CEXT_781881 [Caerostris extrusa]
MRVDYSSVGVFLKILMEKNMTRKDVSLTCCKSTQPCTLENWTEEHRENARIPICPWRRSFPENAISCTGEGKVSLLNFPVRRDSFTFRFSDRVTTFIKSVLDRRNKYTLSGTC